MFSQQQLTGLNGERWVAEQLADRGYKVRVPGDFDHPGCDLFANALCLEVKFANPTQRKVDGRWHDRWQFHIHPATHAMQGDWAAVLVAEDRQGKKYPFIIPHGAIGERRHLQITSHPVQYRGWMARFLYRWDVIDYLAGKHYRLWPVFEAWPGVRP